MAVVVCHEGVGWGEGVKGCAEGEGGAVVVVALWDGVNGSAPGEVGCVGGGGARGGVGARSGRLAGLSLVGLMVVVGRRSPPQVRSGLAVVGLHGKAQSMVVTDASSQPLWQWL